MTLLENYFLKYRNNIIGIDESFISPFGKKKIIYADWIASGRLYRPIEERIIEQFGPFVGNTHTETTITGTTMTKAYHYAHDVIKKHVNANNDDVIITAGFGMTTVINKLQRIMGLKLPEQLHKYADIPKESRPVVFVTHMEHHSNQTSWEETIANTVVIEPDQDGLVNPQKLAEEIKKYKDRKIKIGSFTACSNVTGIETPYYELAKIMHENKGFCFIDFAASAPYKDIDMHPSDPMKRLDAIFFSPHKFLGGPGTSGVMVFNKILYDRKVPDHPGGGTVDWTNPWGEHRYISDIEAREDGGTPGFIQAIKTALSINLKNEMSTNKIIEREEELLEIAFKRFREIPKIHLLAKGIEDRLGIISFYSEEIHFNLMVKLLNDLYGVQMRGGCSCAGTYGHYLLHIDPTRSKSITDMIDHHDLSQKPGWIRFSLHPTMTNEEINIIMDAIDDIVNNIKKYKKDYIYYPERNEYFHKNERPEDYRFIEEWFKLK